MRRRLLLLTCVALVLLASGALFVDAFGHAQKPTPSDAIVILGAGVMPGGVASNSLRERVAQAVALYRAGLAPIVICTGGVGDFPPAEAVVARTLAIKLGVPGSQVLVEDKSRTTRENARFAARICRERNWKSVILVSQPYHLWRAGRLFEHEGLSVSGSPVPHPRIDELAETRVWWALREAVASLRDSF